MSDVVDQLLAARDLIADEERWCQKANARDQVGFPVTPTSPRAVSWCANGAVAKVVNTWLGTGGFTYLRKAAEALYETKVPPINDNFGHAAVMAVYDEAIRLAKDEGA